MQKRFRIRSAKQCPFPITGRPPQGSPAFSPMEREAAARMIAEKPLETFAAA